MFVIDNEMSYFEFKNGKNEYKIPEIGCLPLDDYEIIADNIKGKGPAEVIHVIIGVIEKEAPGSTKGLTVRQADKLVTAYLKTVAASGASLGE